MFVNQQIQQARLATRSNNSEAMEGNMAMTPGKARRKTVATFA